MIITPTPDGNFDLYPERSAEFPEIEIDPEYDDEGGRWANGELAPTVERVLGELESSHASEQMGVADILRTIASNGDGQEDPEFLLVCAGEIRAAAEYFIREVQKSLMDKHSPHAELVSKPPHTTWGLILTYPADTAPAVRQVLSEKFMAAGWQVLLRGPEEGRVEEIYTRPGHGVFGSWQPHEARKFMEELKTILAEHGITDISKRKLKMKDLI